VYYWKLYLHREAQFQEMDQNSIENLINKMRLEKSRLLGILVLAAFTASAIQLACNSENNEEVIAAINLNAEICSQGQGRSTSIKVKNLDVSIWTNVVVTLAKGDLEYSYLLDTLAPENTIPAQPITDSRLFSFEDLGGSAPSKVTNEQVHQRRLLHNFSNIQQASINISGPYIGKWDGKVKTCK